MANGSGNGMGKAGLATQLGSSLAVILSVYMFLNYLQNQNSREEVAAKLSREQLTELIAGQTAATRANAEALRNLELAVKEANSSVKQIGQVSLSQILGMTRRVAEGQEEVKKAVTEAVKPEGRQ